MPSYRKPADLARDAAEKRQATKVERLDRFDITKVPKKPPAPSVKVRRRSVEKRA